MTLTGPPDVRRSEQSMTRGFDRAPEVAEEAADRLLPGLHANRSPGAESGKLWSAELPRARRLSGTTAELRPLRQPSADPRQGRALRPQLPALVAHEFDHRGRIAAASRASRRLLPPYTRRGVDQSRRRGPRARRTTFPPVADGSHRRHIVRPGDGRLRDHGRCWRSPPSARSSSWPRRLICSGSPVTSPPRLCSPSPYSSTRRAVVGASERGRGHRPRIRSEMFSAIMPKVVTGNLNAPVLTMDGYSAGLADRRMTAPRLSGRDRSIQNWNPGTATSLPRRS